MPDLSVFLPWSLSDLAGRALAGRPAWRVCDGTVLFCDVAGFTPLTEALSVLGKEGAEELTRLLNAYFTRMIGLVEEEGGDVLRFGGDAMTVFFPGGGRAALRAAYRMMEAMGDFSSLPTRAGTFRLSMKIGAAFGTVQMGFLGDEEVGFDFYAAGAPLDAAAEAEHRASPGDVVCHPTACVAIPPGAPIIELEGGFRKLDGPWRDGALPSGTVRSQPDAASLARLVPEYLAERAGEGSLGEHRGTAVLFLSFREDESLTGDPAGQHEGLERIYRLFATTTRRFGGVLNKLDMGDKGCKALLLFGSPYAIENREEMAALCALEIQDSPEAAAARFRMGITSSQLFSGPVGSPRRREFTVMGDGINLAARLMQASVEGGILCDRAIAGAAGRALAFEALEPIRVKGKRTPVEVFVPLRRGGAEAEGGARITLVEREAHQEALAKTLFGEGGKPLALVGEAGVGKSALVEWAKEQAKLRQIPVTRVLLAPFSTDRPYVAWRGAIRSVVGLEKGDGPERAEALRERALTGEPAGYRPLLNPFLDLPEETTPATRNLSPKERKDLTFAMVARLLQASGERVLLLDSLQWADPLSLDLLSFLLQEAASAPWRLVASLRPGTDVAERLAGSMERLEVTPLSREGVGFLLREIHAFAEVPPEVHEWFMVRSRGNPALAAALVAALDAANLVARDAKGGRRIDADRLFASDFPETLEGLYMARVDRLPRREREVLQAASILGVSVSGTLLRQVVSLEEGDLAAALADLGRSGLLLADTWGARPYWKFEDPLLRDAVYSSLPFAVRREGHRKVAENLEAGAGEEHRLWPVLAHHFGQAGDEVKARRYHRGAGREAAGRFDNITALRHLEASCGTLTADPEDLEDAFSLLDIYTFLGRRENFQQLLARLGPLEAQMGTPQRARLIQFRARDSWQGQRWEEAEKLLMEAKNLYEEIGDTSGIGKCYVNLVGGIYGPTGRLAEAGACLEKALALPEGPGQSPWRTLAAMNLGVVCNHIGETDRALVLFNRAYQVAVKGRLGPQRGLVAVNLCSVLLESGKFLEAAQWGNRALAVLESFALRGVLLNVAYQLAAAKLSSGFAREAEEALESVRRRSEAQGNEQVSGLASQGLLQAKIFSGDWSGALALARQALAEFQRLSNGRDYRITLAMVGNLCHSLGAREDLVAIWKEVRGDPTLRDVPGTPPSECSLERVRGWMLGDGEYVEHPEEFLTRAGKDNPEERLERLLWICEEAMDQRGEKVTRAYLEMAREALSRWPYFDARLRILRLEIRLEGESSPSHRKEACALLGRCMGGVHGLRLLCLLWEKEPQIQRKKALRLRALRRLYFIHANSPGWAWGKVAAFSEVRAVLKGP
jgi:class 3 adenylate cyclase/tetratricopeptide (TPR) repeat protein